MSLIFIVKFVVNFEIIKTLAQEEVKRLEFCEFNSITRPGGEAGLEVAIDLLTSKYRVTLSVFSSTRLYPDF